MLYEVITNRYSVYFYLFFDIFILFFLGLCHPALPCKLSIIGEEPELGIFPCQDVDIVGHILGFDKALEPVSHQVLLQGKTFAEAGRDGHGLPGQAGEAVVHGGAA